jgi:hypothetical protein
MPEGIARMSDEGQEQRPFRLLNIGCGGVRPPEPWINVDTLLAQHRFYGPECDQLKAEPNYHEFDVSCPLWPWHAVARRDTGVAS